MRKVKYTTLKITLVEENKNREEIAHFCCERSVAFKKFKKEKAEEFVKAVQGIAQTLGELLGFSVY